MQAVKTKGLSLSGKARRRHKAGRAARLFDQQLIMDYIDSDDTSAQEPGGDRPIPVGHRRESLIPSAVTFQHVANGTDDQLELPLDKNDANTEEAICFVRAGKATIVETPQGLSARTTEDRKPTLKSVPDSLSASWASWRIKRRRRSASTGGFTIGGFLYGCAMGAAAAGLMLVVLQATIG